MEGVNQEKRLITSSKQYQNIRLWILNIHNFVNYTLIKLKKIPMEQKNLK